jgi:hypothetical protein
MAFWSAPATNWFIQDGRLFWRSAFSHGEEDMEQLERVDAWPGGSVHVFEFGNGDKVRVAVMQGYMSFLDQLHRAYPEVNLPSAAYAKLMEHLRL